MFSENFKFCTRCGGALGEMEVEGIDRLVCGNCGFVQYLNPTPAAGVCLTQDGKILLVKRAAEPKKGLWQIPAGFLEVNENVEECAVRELKEETNLDVELTGLIGVYSVFDDPRYVCLLVIYSGRIVGGELQAGDDAADICYFSPDELPQIAFECHKRVIEELIKSSAL